MKQAAKFSAKLARLPVDAKGFKKEPHLGKFLLEVQEDCEYVEYPPAFTNPEDLSVDIYFNDESCLTLHNLYQKKSPIKSFVS